MRPNPTIVIQADHAWCLNCNKTVSDIYAKKHIRVNPYEYGCWIDFEYVSTPATINKKSVVALRDDLTWRDVDWA